jgi:8-amino-7-oxononanoate synthase
MPVNRKAWNDWVDSETESVKAQSRWRRLRPLDGQGPDFRLADGRAVVSFASNDYLGLSNHPRVRAAGHDALERWGAGAGSSRLIVGDRPIHGALEDDIATWRDSEAALVFPTGFQTNLGVLTTFGAGTRIVSDELNHASIIDGARLAKAEVTIYRHGDVEQAAQLVGGAPGRAVLVTDTVFSMDGDVADVEGLGEVCARADALLVLDDAHAVFNEGARPGGDAAYLRVGTLSKMLGSQGGYVAGPRSWIDLLINRARSFIFTTGLSPASAATALAALAICRSSEGDTLRATLRRHIDTVRLGHNTPIIPVVIGDETATLDAADSLLQHGLLVPAIRPPTVPAGASRLRVSLSAAHSEGDVARLVAALEQLA